MRLLFMSFIFFLASPSFCQSIKLKPGFDKKEYVELLKVTAKLADSLYNINLPQPTKFKKAYHSPVMALDNCWELWTSDDSLAVISIRGSTSSTISWVENFYSAMIPAKGELIIGKEDTFRYALCNDNKAAVHTGWMIAAAMLSKDIINKIDSISKAGISNIYITGHSQGGAIAYLLTSYLYSLQQQNIISTSIQFKTYCSAAPKPGNLFYAYSYETITKGGWGFNVVNAADWAPESPMTIQTSKDFNKSNPFQLMKNDIKKSSFVKRLLFNYVFNNMDRSAVKVTRKFQKHFGQDMGKIVSKYIPGFVTPIYYKSTNYVRTGNAIVLYPDADYYKIFPDNPGDALTHHKFEAYLYLIERY